MLHWWGYMSCAALHLAWPGRPFARKRSMWWAAVYDCAAFSMSHSFPSPLAHRLDLLCARSHWEVALACCCPHAAAYSALLSAAPLRRFGSSTCLRTTSAAFGSVCTFECGRGAMPGGACAVDQLTSLFHRILARFLAGAGPHTSLRECASAATALAAAAGHLGHPGTWNSSPSPVMTLAGIQLVPASPTATLRCLRMARSSFGDGAM